MTDVLLAPERTGLACESQLRVAAATLGRASASEVTATTVLGILGADDLPAFNSLVRAIEEDLDVDACVRMYVGSFSVRFSRRAGHEHVPTGQMDGVRPA